MIWKPNVVASAIIEDDGRFLLIEETADDGAVVLNQPAGHLDPGETLFDAARREVLEETAWYFEPEGIVGVYLMPKPGTDITYMRVCFHGRPLREEAGRALDHGIIRTLWLTPEELAARRAMHRSLMVQRCMDDYLAGHRYPLDLLQHLDA